MITNNNQQQPAVTGKPVAQRGWLIRWILAFLTGWGDLTRALEATLIDNLAATVPWLAPLVPAYMIYHSLAYVIKFPVQVAYIGAAVVEFLGLATVVTTFQFWDWNDQRRQGDPTAPTWVAAGAAGFYLLVVLVVNILLDLKTPAEQLVAKALLSTLSIIAMVTLAVRSQHARRQAQSEKQAVQAAATQAIQEQKDAEKEAREQALELEKFRIAEASRVAIEQEQIRALEDRRAQVSVARIEAKTSRHFASNVASGPAVPTFARGYPGFVEYLSWLGSLGKTFDKHQAAQDMGRSVRMIERYLVEGAGNGAGELLSRLSDTGSDTTPTLE